MCSIELNSDLFKFQANVSDANLFYNGLAFCSANGIANCPSADGLLIAYRNSSGNIGSQFFIGYQNTGCWYRDVTNNSAREWVKLAKSSDLDKFKPSIANEYAVVSQTGHLAFKKPSGAKTFSVVMIECVGYGGNRLQECAYFSESDTGICYSTPSDMIGRPCEIKMSCTYD